jgi:hypothetical protein
LRGEREVKGREALVRVLTGDRPLPSFLQHDLVALFSDSVKLKSVQPLPWSKYYDPSEHSLIQEQRRLVFKHRRRNTRTTEIKDSYIAWFIESEMRKAQAGRKHRTNVVADAVRLFGLKSKQAIYDALKRHKKRYPNSPV